MKILCSKENSDKARKKKILIRKYSSTVKYSKSVQPRRTVTKYQSAMLGGLSKVRGCLLENLTQKYKNRYLDRKIGQILKISVLFLSCILTQYSV